MIQAWDPRPAFALHCSGLAEKYEQKLRENPSTDPQIVEFLVQERHRIFLLFKKLLPEFETAFLLLLQLMYALNIVQFFYGKIMFMS